MVPTSDEFAERDADIASQAEPVGQLGSSVRPLREQIEALARGQAEMLELAHRYVERTRHVTGR